MQIHINLSPRDPHYYHHYVDERLLMEAAHFLGEQGIPLDEAAIQDDEGILTIEVTEDQAFAVKLRLTLIDLESRRRARAELRAAQEAKEKQDRIDWEKAVTERLAAEREAKKAERAAWRAAHNWTPGKHSKQKRKVR